MSTELFLFLLLAVSLLTGLMVEALKKLLDEHNKIYRTNTLAGIVAIVLSVAVFAGYIVLTGSTFNSALVVYLIALVFLSWLCAMLGYDKVIQTLSQLKSN
jgi:uncharacterized membrane protein YkgB